MNQSWLLLRCFDALCRHTKMTDCFETHQTKCSESSDVVPEFCEAVTDETRFASRLCGWSVSCFEAFLVWVSTFRLCQCWQQYRYITILKRARRYPKFVGKRLVLLTLFVTVTCHISPSKQIARGKGHVETIFHRMTSEVKGQNHCIFSSGSSLRNLVGEGQKSCTASSIILLQTLW